MTEASAFLRLPTELRLQIYDHLLPDVPVLPADAWTNARLRKDMSLCHPAIMRVNKFIHAETMDMLHSKCALGIYISDVCAVYLRGIGISYPSLEDDSLARHSQRFAAENPHAKVMLYDANKFLNGVLDNPGKYAIKNTTSYCLDYANLDVLYHPELYGCLPLDEYFWYNSGHM